MSYIAAGTKADHLPMKRPPRTDSTGRPITKQRSQQSRAVRKLKRAKPEGQSLKAWMSGTTVGAAWLQRKRTVKS